MQVLSPEHNQDLVRKHATSVEFEEEYRKRKLEKDEASMFWCCKG